MSCGHIERKNRDSFLVYYVEERPWRPIQSHKNGRQKESERWLIGEGDQIAQQSSQGAKICVWMLGTRS